MADETNYGNTRFLVNILAGVGVVLGTLSAIGGFLRLAEAYSGAMREYSIMLIAGSVAAVLATVVVALILKAFLDLVDHAGAIRKHLEASEADDKEPNS